MKSTQSVENSLLDENSKMKTDSDAKDKLLKKRLFLYVIFSPAGDTRKKTRFTHFLLCFLLIGDYNYSCPYKDAKLSLSPHAA